MLVSTALLLASLGLTAGGLGFNAYNTDKNDLTKNEASKVLEEIEKNYPDISSNPYWNSLSETEKTNLLREYRTGDSIFAKENVALDQLDSDLAEYYKISGAAPLYSDYVDVDKALQDAQASIDADNQKLLDSLNEDLKATGNAYTQSRDAMLTQQYQRNAQTMDTMASEMSRARRNAIESGASAGIRIAGNVNAILSAQNKMSQESLNTSNQLAQMLVNQRNAESGLRNQWRDAQMSTYDRVHNRAQNEMSLGQARYDKDLTKYNENLDKSTSDSNLLTDRMAKYKSNY